VIRRSSVAAIARASAWVLTVLPLPLIGCDAGEPPTEPPAPPTSAATTADAPAFGGEILSAAGGWRVRWTPDPAEISLDALFSVDLLVAPASPETASIPPADVEVAIDARMPHHRHGMLVRPTVRRIGPDRFRCEGLMLHMPGYWELHVDLVTGGSVERAQASFEIDG
jgi:hypothetical protein